MPSKLCHSLLIIAFAGSLLSPVPSRADNLLGLPEPGTMVNLSPAYEPLLIKGLKVHPENPFLFDFIIDSGNDTSDIFVLKQQSQKLIKYFLTAMTVPEADLWVNLSPYERNRIIAGNLGQTVMGRDMLAQDYILKQLTASLIYPERDLGRRFWDEVYAKAQALYGTTQVPVNTFNKVWIVADKADIYEHENTAYVVGAHLKVMLEEDYLAQLKHVEVPRNNTSTLGSNIVRKIILPQLEREVNNGRNFAPLRQMFYSMILASWYKMALKDALLTKVYGNKSKVKVGVNQSSLQTNEAIFLRYLKAYKKGVFNYIKEEDDAPRKYFSGGTNFEDLGQLKGQGGVLNVITDRAMVTPGALSARGQDYDARITFALVQAQALKKIKKAMRPLYQQLETKTVVWFSKKGNGKGLVDIRELEQYKGTNTELDTGNPQFWQKYSDQEVFLKPGAAIELEEVQEIAGADARRVWDIIERARKGIPEVRYTRVSELTVGPAQERVFLNGIEQNKNFVLLPQEVLEQVKKGRDVKILLNGPGVPEKFRGRTAALTGNNAELLPEFNPRTKDVLGQTVKLAQPIAVRVNHVFIVRIRDRMNRRDLYFVPFNQRILDRGDLRLSALGGGVQFEEGGFEYYREHVDPLMKTLPNEDPRDVRVIIDGRNLEKMIKLLNKGKYIEKNANRELVEELNGESGLFRSIPPQWLVPEPQQKLKVRNVIYDNGDLTSRQSIEAVLDRWFDGKRRVFGRDYVERLLNSAYFPRKYFFYIEESGKITAVLIRLGSRYPGLIVGGFAESDQEQKGRGSLIWWQSTKSLAKDHDIIIDIDRKGPAKAVAKLKEFILSKGFREMRPDSLQGKNEADAYAQWIKHLADVGESQDNAYVLFRPQGAYVEPKIVTRNLKAYATGARLPVVHPAMLVHAQNPAMLGAVGTDKNGGIDFNAGNMQVNVHGSGPDMKIDPAMLARIQSQSFDGLEFQIRSLVPIANLQALLN